MSFNEKLIVDQGINYPWLLVPENNVTNELGNTDSRNNSSIVRNEKLRDYKNDELYNISLLICDCIYSWTNSLLKRMNSAPICHRLGPGSRRERSQLSLPIPID